MREDISSMDKDCDLPLLTRNTEVREKKKKKRKQTNGSKKRGHSTTPQNSEDTEKPQTRALPHESSSLFLPSTPPQGHARDQLPKAKACSREDGERGGRRTKKQLKPVMALSKGADKNNITRAPSQGDVAELSAQARESLRWEGVLEDPLAEEMRLEVYRANRRQRYLAQRQALLEDTQMALRKDSPKEDREDMALPDLDQ